MNGFFISYRRQDSADACASIYSHLDLQFRWVRVFKDIDDIPPGSNFVKVIQEALQQCEVLLAVIGPQWLTVTTSDGKRRLDDPNDFVRLEIETALNLRIPIVVLLVHGACMPNAKQLPQPLASLAQCPAFSIRPDSCFQRDMDEVIQAILRWWPVFGRWHATYPRVAMLSGLAFVFCVASLLISIPSIVSKSSSYSPFSFMAMWIFSIIAIALGFGCQTFALFRLIHTRRWGWLISMFFPGMISLGLMGVLFGLIGPIKPRRKPEPVYTKRSDYNNPYLPNQYLGQSSSQYPLTKQALLGSVQQPPQYPSLSPVVLMPQQLDPKKKKLGKGILFLIISLCICGIGGAVMVAMAVVGQFNHKNPQHFKVGDRVNVGGTWQVVVNSVKTNTCFGFSTPKSGYVYLEIDVTLTNISGIEQHTSSMMDWYLADRTGQKYNEESSISGGPLSPNGNVEAGSPMRGTLSYEVPSTQKSFTLAFKPDLFAPGQTTWDISVSSTADQFNHSENGGHPQHFKVGDTVNVACTWQVVVNSVKTNTGNEYPTPRSGYVYVEVDVTLTNISSTEQSTSALNWYLADRTGQRYNESSISGVPLSPSGKVEAGSLIRGTLSYEVPSSQESFTLAFEPDIFASGQAIWDISVS